MRPELSKSAVVTAVDELAPVELAAEATVSAACTVSAARAVSAIVTFADSTVPGVGCLTSDRSHAIRATTSRVKGEIFTLHRRSATDYGHEFVAWREYNRWITR